MSLTISAIVSVLSRVVGPLRRFFRRPALEFIPFDAARDLRTWDLRGSVARIQKVFTLEVQNSGKDVAKRCVALLEVRAASASTGQGLLYVIHWADIDYAFRTTGAEPIDIGPEGRRLDVIFSFMGQGRPGCWIATPAALFAPLATTDYLAPGHYDLVVEVNSENASSVAARFRIVSPIAWDDLDVSPVDAA